MSGSFFSRFSLQQRRATLRRLKCSRRPCEVVCSKRDFRRPAFASNQSTTSSQFRRRHCKRKTSWRSTKFVVSGDRSCWIASTVDDLRQCSTPKTRDATLEGQTVPMKSDFALNRRRWSRSCRGTESPPGTTTLNEQAASNFVLQAR